MQAHEQTEVLLNSIPLAVYLWKKDGTIFDCNETALKLFNVKTKQDYIDRFREFSPEYQSDGQLSTRKGRELLNKVYDEGRCVFEWMHQASDGSPIPAEVTLVRVNFDGEFIAVGYARDLREHKQMMQEIEEQTSKLTFQSYWYKSILDATPFPITVTDSNMCWTFVNKAVEDFLGTKLEDMLGKPCSNWDANICNTPDCGIACAKRGLKRTYFTHNGASYQVDVEILKTMEGGVAGFIEVVQDITQLERLAKQQAEALAANNAKSAFLSAMSHEMRTPMNAIIGMVTIGKNAQEIERKNYALNKIEDASKHLLGVINDVLDMSKIEANKLELSRIAFDLKLSLQKALSLVQFTMDANHLRFSMNIDENMPTLFIGDDQRLTQVIMNLLSNAIKFTPREGKINLDVSLLGEENGICELRFDVADSGIGMSPEQQAKLFRAFEQAESGTTRKYGGTGLGLIISKGIIELMGGRIWIESELGKGARFIFTAKLLRIAENINLQSGPEEKPQLTVEDIAEKVKGKKILIVDDIDINREILVSLLSDTGIIIDTAENGRTALDKVAADPNNYDLIFMDMQMPEMDGLDATRHIRALKARKHIPIIAMTANVFQDDIEKCSQAGMDDHIGKPFSMATVLEKLYNYLVEPSSLDL